MEQWSKSLLLLVSLLLVIHHGRGSPMLNDTKSFEDQPLSADSSLAPREELPNVASAEDDDISHFKGKAAALLDDLLGLDMGQSLGMTQNDSNINVSSEAEGDLGFGQLVRREREEHGGSEAAASADEDASSLLRPIGSLIKIEICLAAFVPRNFLHLWIHLLLLEANVSIGVILQSDLLVAIALGRAHDGSLQYVDIHSGVQLLLQGVVSLRGLASRLAVYIKTQLSLRLRIVICITIILRRSARALDLTDTPFGVQLLAQALPASPALVTGIDGPPQTSPDAVPEQQAASAVARERKSMDPSQSEVMKGRVARLMSAIRRKPPTKQRPAQQRREDRSPHRGQSSTWSRRAYDGPKWDQRESSSDEYEDNSR